MAEQATKEQVETVAESWKHGASMTSAAQASGLTLAEISNLYALWNVHKRRRRRHAEKLARSPAGRSSSAGER